MTTALTITAIDNEPRILDTDLAIQLGIANPRTIRTEIITTHRDELASYGGLLAMPTNPGPLGGRPGTAYYLNEEQALLIYMFSRTPLHQNDTNWGAFIGVVEDTHGRQAVPFVRPG